MNFLACPRRGKKGSERLAWRQTKKFHHAAQAVRGALAVGGGGREVKGVSKTRKMLDRARVIPVLGRGLLKASNGGCGLGFRGDPNK